MIIVPNAAEILLLDLLLAAISSSNAYVALYTNDVTPDADTVYADFTEGAWTGYARLTPTWSAAVTDAFEEAISYSQTLTYTSGSGSPVDVYGYFVATDGDELLFAERFAAAPIAISSGTDPIEYIIAFKLRQRVP